MTNFVFRFPSPHYDAGNGPGSSPTLAPVLTPSERLAKAKQLIVELENLGIDEIKDLVSDASVTIHEVEAKVAAEAQKIEDEVVAAAKSVGPEIDAIASLIKEELAKFQAFEKTFCEQHALSIQAVNTWIAVIGGIVLLKLLKVI